MSKMNSRLCSFLNIKLETILLRLKNLFNNAAFVVLWEKSLASLSLIGKLTSLAFDSDLCMDIISKIASNDTYHISITAH